MISTMLTLSCKQCFSRLLSPSNLGALGLTACLLVTGCSHTDETTDEQTTSSEQSESTTTADGELTSSAPSVNEKPTKPQQSVIAEGKPVSYDIGSWHKKDVKDINLDDLKDIQAIFGKVAVTDENSLDYASNSAIKYRFMEGNEPYLDIIDSQEYLELGWYYANPNDSKSEKEISKQHAEKVYTAARSLMGEAGGHLVSGMLGGQIVKNKEVGGQQVELAKCEFYSCMLIIKKPI